MSRAPSTVLALIVLVGLATPVVAAEPDPVMTDDPQVIPGEVIVTYRDGMAREQAQARGLAVMADLGTPGRAAPALVSTGGRAVSDVVAELKADPAVAQAEPNYRVQLVDEGAIAALAVNDPQTSGQYSLDRMRVRDAWSRETGAGNLIAVLDTGVQFSHPDLAGRVVRGRDFVNDDTSAADDNGHGTWVAGIIAANSNDGYGIAGIRWSDKIMPVKIMNREGTGSTSDLIAAIRWSADQGADVINMSVGGVPYSQIMQDAVSYAFAKGAVLVGAAGRVVEVRVKPLDSPWSDAWIVAAWAPGFTRFLHTWLAEQQAGTEASLRSELYMGHVVQAAVRAQWEAATQDNIAEVADATWFFSEVRRLYGFDVPGVDYEAETEVDVAWP